MRELTKPELEAMLRSVTPMFFVYQENHDLDKVVILKIREYLYKREGINSANEATQEEFYKEATRYYDHFRGHMGDIARSLQTKMILGILEVVYPKLYGGSK